MYVKHGQTTSRTYSSWHHMNDRCFNDKNDAYPMYGGRGITVSPRWASFEAFKADMGERPEGMTLDRIERDGNYEPGNCRWATSKEQNRHLAPTKLTRVDAGSVRLLAEWGYNNTRLGRMFGVHRKTVADVVAGRTWV